MKQCSCCKNEIPKSLFYKDPKSKDGLSSWCNECRKENVRKHRMDPKYRKKQQEWNNRWREKNHASVLKIRLKSQNKIYLFLKKAGFVTVEIRERILKRDRSMCLNCGTKKQLTVDHIKPISRGGKTEDENLQILCRSCNSKKQQKETNYRMLERG